MPIYGLYDRQDVLKVYLTIHDDGRHEWDFSRDEWGGRRLSEDDREEIVRAIERYERSYAHEPGFLNRPTGYTVRRVTSP